MNRAASFYRSFCLTIASGGMLLGVAVVGCAPDESQPIRKPLSDGGKQEVKPAPKPEPKPLGAEEVKPQSKAQSKTELKPVAGPELKPAANANEKPDAKPPVPSEVKPDTKAETKGDSKPEMKPQAGTEVKPQVPPEVKPEEGKVDVKAEPDPVPDAKKSAAAESGSVRIMVQTALIDAPAAEAATPKFSTIAPAGDLCLQLTLSLTDLEKAIATEEEFKGQVEGRFTHDGNTIALLAAALGLHDEASPLKAKAAAIAASAKSLTEAKDYAATKKSVADLKAAVEGEGKGGSTLKWAKISPLGDLMSKQVPAIHAKLTTNLRHFKKRSNEVAANAAAMALIAESAKLYLDETSKPTEGKAWNEFAARMLAAAADLGVKAHAKDEAGAKAAMDVLNESCHACHKIFNPDK